MNDQPFQSILSTGWLVLFPILLYHRIRSQMTRERLDRRQEGLRMLVGLRLVGLAVAVGLIAYLVDPATMAWASVDLPLGLRWAGLALGATGAVLLVWTLHTLGRNLTDTVVTRRAHQLVVFGPYRWVRHPFYSCVTLCLLSSAIAAANWYQLISSLALFAMFAIRVPTEEAKLVERFGDAYRAYAARTGRFFPRFGT